jgi:type IV secretion system T-DNA border endonuclease VirD2
MNEQPFLDFGRARTVKGRGLYIKLSRAERLRAARGVRQAIVKVRSYPHGMKGVWKAMSYISRKGTLPLEKDTGELVRGLEEQRALVRDWAIDFDKRKDSRDGAHIIFSMPPRSNPEALRKAVRATAARAFPDNEWVFAIHQDKNHPHAHMVLKMRGREQDLKLDPRKADLHRLREIFAEAAREQGVELAASSRAARGVGKKATPQSFYYLKSKGIKPEVERKSFEEAVKELKQNDWKQKPWEKAMAERNKLEREAYRQEARALCQEAEQQTREADRERMLKDARILEQFAERMPKPKTKGQSTKEWIWQKVEAKRREKSRSKNRNNELER